MFDLQDIEKIADLARLKLTDEEKATFVEQFQTILDYFQQIQAVPLPDSVTLDSDKIQAHLRDDHAEPSGVTPDSFSSYLESGHFKVPKVIE